MYISSPIVSVMLNNPYLCCRCYMAVENSIAIIWTTSTRIIDGNERGGFVLFCFCILKSIWNERIDSVPYVGTAAPSGSLQYHLCWLLLLIVPGAQQKKIKIKMQGILWKQNSRGVLVAFLEKEDLENQILNSAEVGLVLRLSVGLQQSRFLTCLLLLCLSTSVSQLRQLEDMWTSASQISQPVLGF